MESCQADFLVCTKCHFSAVKMSNLRGNFSSKEGSESAAFSITHKGLFILKWKHSLWIVLQGKLPLHVALGEGNLQGFRMESDIIHEPNRHRALQMFTTGNEKQGQSCTFEFLWERFRARNALISLRCANGWQCWIQERTTGEDPDELLKSTRWPLTCWTMLPLSTITISH